MPCSLAQEVPVVPCLLLRVPREVQVSQDEAIPQPDGKVCTKCNKWTPRDLMVRSSRNKDGMAANCKECIRLHSKEGLTLKEGEFFTDNGRRATLCPKCGENPVYINNKWGVCRINPDCAREAENRRQKDYYKRNPTAKRAQAVRRIYNLPWDKYEEMLAAQGGRCAICQRKSKRFHVDHDHACCPGKVSCGKCVRGLLCLMCNRVLLGSICQETRKGSDHAIGVLERAITYLWKNGAERIVQGIPLLVDPDNPGQLESWAMTMPFGIAVELLNKAGYGTPQEDCG